MKRIKLLAIAALTLCLFALSSCEKGFFPLYPEDLVGTRWELPYAVDGGYKQYFMWTFTSITEVEFEKHTEVDKDATRESPVTYKVMGTFSYKNLKDTFNVKFNQSITGAEEDVPFEATGNFLVNSMRVKLGTLEKAVIFFKVRE